MNLKSTSVNTQTDFQLADTLECIMKETVVFKFSLAKNCQAGLQECVTEPR